MSVGALRNRARLHELALHGFAQPALPLLLGTAALLRPMRYLPILGWVVVDPAIARKIHSDTTHFSILEEGASGHWWSQMLGDWLGDFFHGAAHRELRSAMNDLYGAERSAAMIAIAGAPMLTRLRDDLAAGHTVDVARFSRLFTTRVMLESTGQSKRFDSDESCLHLFDLVEALADLGKGSWRTTALEPRQVGRGRALAEQIGASVPEVFDSAPPDTFIGRCRQLGFDLPTTRGLTVLFVVAGTITLASTMARLVALLHDTDSCGRLVAEPELVPDAVREALRVTSSMPIVGRGVAADITLSGKRMTAGDRVKVMLWTMDNSVGAFDLARGKLPELRQLWFGSGKHFCLGPALATLELEEFLRALLANGRPWTIVRRRYRGNVFVPLYKRLDIKLR